MATRDHRRTDGYSSAPARIAGTPPCMRILHRRQGQRIPINRSAARGERLPRPFASSTRTWVRATKTRNGAHPGAGRSAIGSPPCESPLGQRRGNRKTPEARRPYLPQTWPAAARHPFRVCEWRWRHLTRSPERRIPETTTGVSWRSPSAFPRTAETGSSVLDAPERKPPTQHRPKDRVHAGDLRHAAGPIRG